MVVSLLHRWPDPFPNTCLSKSDLTHMLSALSWNIQFIELAPRTDSKCSQVLIGFGDTHFFVYPWEDRSVLGFHPVQLAAQTINTHRHTQTDMPWNASSQDRMGSHVLTFMRTFTHSEEHTAVKAPLDMKANIAHLLSISPQGIEVECYKTLLGFVLQ